jgi:hypothetical protein
MAFVRLAAGTAANAARSASWPVVVVADAGEERGQGCGMAT